MFARNAAAAAKSMNGSGDGEWYPCPAKSAITLLGRCARGNARLRQDAQNQQRNRTALSIVRLGYGASG